MASYFRLKAFRLKKMIANTFIKRSQSCIPVKSKMTNYNFRFNAFDFRLKTLDFRLQKK